MSLPTTSLPPQWHMRHQGVDKPPPPRPLFESLTWDTSQPPFPLQQSSEQLPLSLVYVEDSNDLSHFCQHESGIRVPPTASTLMPKGTTHSTHSNILRLMASSWPLPPSSKKMVWQPKCAILTPPVVPRVDISVIINPIAARQYTQSKSPLQH